MSVNLLSKIEETSWFYEANKELCEPHLGKPYVSFSTTDSYFEYLEDWIKFKLVKLPESKKIYAELGTFCGNALEHGYFSDENPNGFTGMQNYPFHLRQEGDEYEKMVLIDLGEYCIIGFCDVWRQSEGLLRDQKTMGAGKEAKYKKDEYIQTVLYKKGLEDQGLEVRKTDVLGIYRNGSHINPPLNITGEYIIIPIEFGEKRLKYALKRVDDAVKGISALKTTYDKYFGK